MNFNYNHTVNMLMHPPLDIFELYSKEGKEKIGTLVCHKSELKLRPSCNNSVLAIDFLEVTTPNNGDGTKILKFAEDYSKQIGCNGYMTLKSDGSYTPDRIPHTFYRKFGFSTLDKKTDKKLDKFIKKGIKATSKDFDCLLMHYPPEEIIQKNNTNFLKKIWNLLRKI